MYSFAQRQDTKVFDEPLFAHYAEHTGIELGRGTHEVVQQMEKDGEKIIKEVILGEHNKPVVFIKSLANQLVGVDKSFLQRTQNIFLIRDPLEIINAYTKFLEKPTMTHIGIKAVYDLHSEISKQGLSTILLTYKDLLKHPETMLQKLCTSLEIPFDKNMLSWQAGPKPEDGGWAKIWYTSLHKSTGFKTYQAKEINLPESLHSLAEESRKYYDLLYKCALKP